MSKSTAEHRAKAPSHVTFALLTISTSRFKELEAGKPVDNPSGETVVKLLEEAGHRVAYSAIIPDNTDMIGKSLRIIVEIDDIDAVITCGGTGITKTDVTIETVAPLLEKDLPGFGEIFRKLSYESIGAAAVITRATAGLLKEKVIFCLPGSPQGVELALKNLIIPEVGHIVKHVREQ